SSSSKIHSCPRIVRAIRGTNEPRAPSSAPPCAKPGHYREITECDIEFVAYGLQARRKRVIVTTPRAPVGARGVDSGLRLARGGPLPGCNSDVLAGVDFAQHGTTLLAQQFFVVLDVARSHDLRREACFERLAHLGARERVDTLHGGDRG